MGVASRLLVSHRMEPSSEWTSRVTARRSSNMKILLVDDDEDFRHGLAENLRDDGHHVLEYFQPDKIPDAQLSAANLVITDYMMNGEEGFAFANRLHRLRPNVPVILVTAYSTAQIEKAVAASGFISLLHKPFDYMRLENLIGDLT